MKKLRWQLIIIFITGLVVGALLLSEQPTPTQIAATPVPETGGIYTEALIGSMQRLNPVLDFYNQPDHDIDRLIFSSLLKFDSRGLPQPDIAKSWAVSKDGTVYNFLLYANAKWQDGAPVTADDVVFTVDLLKNGGDYVPKDLQVLWKDVEVEAVNENWVQFRLPEPFAPFQDYLTFGILPKHLFEGQNIDEIANSQINLKPIGSGPYRVDQIDTDNGQISGVTFSISDSYYKDKPFIEQFVFEYYPDSQAAYDAYQSGKVMGISHVSQDILEQVLANTDLSVYSGRMPEMYLVLFNLKDPQATFLNEPAVRRALMAGLNRPLMINRILNGQAVIANGVIMPDSWAFYPDSEVFSYAPVDAQKQLKDAGYVSSGDAGSIRQKDDTPMSFELIYPDDDTFKALAQQIVKDWGNIGVEVTANPLPYNQLLDRLDQRNYQAALITLNLTNAYDPDPYPFWDQAQMTGGQNYTQWDNRMASELLEQARLTVDLQERIRLYRNFQVLFAQELPALPLFYPVYTYAVDQQVQGVRMGPLFDPSDRFATVTKWFLVAKRPTNSPTLTPTP